MAQTLEQFATKCHDILKTDPGPSGRKKVCALLQDVLKDGTFVSTHLDDSVPERKFLYEDPELEFCILAHHNKGAKESPPHDPGPSWAIYGQAKGETFMSDWDKVESATPDKPGKVKHRRVYKLEPGMDENAFYDPSDFTYPSGTQICEVEIDPDTGAVTLERYAIVDDVGTVINPLTLKGQIHGGVAQGVGQILGEQVVYDPESGQLLTPTFMDYGIPRADTIPEVAIGSNPVPTALNPLGAKGAGEAGTVGALPAVMNAVMDALAPLGVRDLDMPASPDRVWSAIRAATTRS